MGGIIPSSEQRQQWITGGAYSPTLDLDTDGVYGEGGQCVARKVTWLPFHAEVAGIEQAGCPARGRE